MSSFTITTPETSVSLRPTSVKQGEHAQGSATYSVTNKTGATIRTGLRVKPGGGAEQSWFEVRGGDERDIAPGETASFSIGLAVPGGSEAYSFNAVAVNLADPDNDFETGSTIAFEAPPIAADGGGDAFPWWIVAVAAALVVVVVGVILGFVIMSDRGDSEAVEVAEEEAVAEPAVGRVPFHDLVRQSRIIAPDEFARYGIAEIKAAPSGSYCAEAVAAVTTRTKPGLTTGTRNELRRCTAVPVSIEFTNSVRRVTVQFYGSVEEYPLRAFDSSGAQVASATQNGVLIYNQAPPAEVSVASRAANIKRIVFGRDTHGTLVHAIAFE